MILWNIYYLESFFFFFFYVGSKGKEVASKKIQPKPWGNGAKLQHNWKHSREGKQSRVKRVKPGGVNMGCTSSVKTSDIKQIQINHLYFFCSPDGPSLCQSAKQMICNCCLMLLSWPDKLNIYSSMTEPFVFN